MPSTRRRKLRPDQLRKQMIETGDVLGLLNHLDELDPALSTSSALNDLSRAIQRKAKDDVCGLTEDGFATIIGLTAELLLRCRSYITQRLRDHEEKHHHARLPIPADIVSEGWLERAEKLSRFLMEVAAMRARVRHVTGLEKASGPQPRQRSQAPEPLALRAGQAGSGQTEAAQGWRGRRTA